MQVVGMVQPPLGIEQSLQMDRKTAFLKLTVLLCFGQAICECSFFVGMQTVLNVRKFF